MTNYEAFKTIKESLSGVSQETLLLTAKNAEKAMDETYNTVVSALNEEFPTLNDGQFKIDVSLNFHVNRYTFQVKMCERQEDGEYKSCFGSGFRVEYNFDREEGVVIDKPTLHWSSYGADTVEYLWYVSMMGKVANRIMNGTLNWEKLVAPFEETQTLYEAANSVLADRKSEKLRAEKEEKRLEELQKRDDFQNSAFNRQFIDMGSKNYYRDDNSRRFYALDVLNVTGMTPKGFTYDVTTLHNSGYEKDLKEATEDTKVVRSGRMLWKTFWKRYNNQSYEVDTLIDRI